MRRQLIGALFLPLLVSAAFSPPAEAPGQPALKQWYGYFYAQGTGTTAQGRRTHLLITNVFGYCTPTHNFGKLREADAAMLEELVRQRMAHASRVTVVVAGNAGNSTVQEAEKYRQIFMASAAKRGATVEETVYNVGSYAPASECR